MFPAYERFKKVLAEAMDSGVIHDYAECPGVPRIDIIPEKDSPVKDWIQVEVIR